MLLSLSSLSSTSSSRNKWMILSLYHFLCFTLITAALHTSTQTASLSSHVLCVLPMLHHANKWQWSHDERSYRIRSHLFIYFVCVFSRFASILSKMCVVCWLALAVNWQNRIKSNSLERPAQMRRKFKNNELAKSIQVNEHYSSFSETPLYILLKHK